MSKIFLVQTMDESMVCPIAFSKDDKIYNLSNNQRKGNYLNYVEVNGKEEIEVYNYNYTYDYPIFDNSMFEKYLPNFTKHSKELVNNPSSEVLLVEHLVKFGFNGFNKPFMLDESCIKTTRDIWKCSWSTCDERIQIAFEFFECYYVYELVVNDGMITCTKQRFKKQLFNTAQEF